MEIQMGDFDALFDQIMHAKPVGNFLPRLPVGRHHLAIKRFNGKNSDMGAGVILEADFFVMQSTTLQPGDLRGWAWFPTGQGLSGQYESARQNEFLATVGAGVNDTGPTKIVGGRLIDGTYVGVQILATVTPSFEKDGVTQKRSKKKNDPLFNVSWEVVKGQTQETVIACRALMEQIQAAAAPAPAAAPPVVTASQSGAFGGAPAPTTAASPAFGGGFGQPASAPAPAAAPPPAFGGGFGQPAAAPAASPTGSLADILAALKPKG